MSCPLASGFTRDCSDSIGGIEEVLISERDNIDSYTEAAHEITAITQAAATSFYSKRTNIVINSSSRSNTSSFFL